MFKWKRKHKDEDESDGGGSSSEEEDRKKEKPEGRADAYVTMETQKGQIEHVPVDMNYDQFSNKNSILDYLAKVGEIQRPGIEPPRNSLTLRLDQIRKSHVANGSAKPDDEDDTMDEITQMEMAAARRKRSDSILTPDLVTSMKKDQLRICSKGGQVNVEMVKVKQRGKQYFKDFFTTAVDMKWRYVFFVFCASFFASWLFFGVIWYLIALVHGDLDEDHLPGSAKQVSGEFVPCVVNIYNFASCFLFSVETQHTIGYGSRSTTEQCSFAIIIMCIQSCIGVLFSSCVAGIVFAKLARPKHRSHTIMFSKNAVITQRNGALYLLFRVGNMRRSHLIEAHATAQIVHHRQVTSEGERNTYVCERLQISQEMESEDSYTLFYWPVTFHHKIDESSPFYDMGPKDILKSRFEVILSLEGIVEATGSSVQARSSYLPNEILWGHRYENMMSYNKSKGVYMVDCSNLNAVMRDQTPRMSAKRLEESRRKSSLEEEDEEEEEARMRMRKTGNALTFKEEEEVELEEVLHDM